jgi:hypothetical protein
MNAQMIQFKSVALAAIELLLVVTFLSMGCSHGKNKNPVESTNSRSVSTQLPREQRAFSEWLNETVPIGVEVGQAKESLATQGFKCEDRNDKEGPTVYCTRSQPIDSFVSYEWRIVVRHHEGRVSNTQGTVNTLGP